MSGYWEAPNDYQSEPYGGQGSVSGVSNNLPDIDPIEALRKVVEEITRKSVKREIRRIGFY